MRSVSYYLIYHEERLSLLPSRGVKPLRQTEQLFEKLPKEIIMVTLRITLNKTYKSVSLLSQWGAYQRSWR
jgi:hypothetical protein